MKRILIPLIILILICLGVGSYALYGIWSEKIELAEAERLSDEMSVYSPSEYINSGMSYDEIYSSFIPGLLEMQKINSDIVGWLYIPGTRIDYPLLQGTDNEYYLKHSPSGEYSVAGSVFFDKRGTDAENIIIYGHNMTEESGIIFYDLIRFQNSDFFNSYRNGYIITNDGVTLLDIFAYALTKPSSEFYLDKADVDFIRENSMHFREPMYSGQLYTLSTCAYDFNDARALLIAMGSVVYIP